MSYSGLLPHISSSDSVKCLELRTSVVFLFCVIENCLSVAQGFITHGGPGRLGGGDHWEHPWHHLDRLPQVCISCSRPQQTQNNRGVRSLSPQSKFLTVDKTWTQQLVAHVVNLSYWIKYHSRTSPNRWFTTMSHSLNQVTRNGQIWLFHPVPGTTGRLHINIKNVLTGSFHVPFPLIIDHMV